MDSESTMLQLVANAADRNRQSYLANFWTTLGFLVVAIGWFITSNEARIYICETSVVKFLSAGIIVGLFISHIVVLIYTYFISSKLHLILLKFNFHTFHHDKTEILSSYSVRWYWLFINIVINGVLFSFLFYQIVSLGSCVTNG